MTVVREKVREMKMFIEDMSELDNRMGELNGQMREEILSIAEKIFGGECTFGEYDIKSDRGTFYLTISANSALQIEKLVEFKHAMGADDIVINSGDIWLEWYL